MLSDPLRCDVADDDHDDNVDNDDDDDDAYSENSVDRINIMDGLSSEALAALLEFQLGHDDNHDDDIDTNTNVNYSEYTSKATTTTASAETKFGKETLCATYRPEDASRIAETLRRLHDREHGSNNTESTTTTNNNDTKTSATVSTSNERVILPMLETIIPSERSDSSNDMDRTIQHYVNVLESDGVLRINGVLSSKLCIECADYIHQTLLQQETCNNNNHHHNDTLDNSRTNDDDTTAKILFGNVFARDNRYDMYLRPNVQGGIVQTTMQSILHQQSTLGQLFQQQLQRIHHHHHPPVAVNHTSDSVFIDAEFHELSSLISDPGSIAQPLHPDSPYYFNTKMAPLWTVFIALQDIAPDMGGTVVVPKTHTEVFHHQLQQPQQPSSGSISTTSTASNTNRYHNIQSLLQSNEYQYYRADLQIGDCIIMDARTFHYGGANISHCSLLEDTNQPVSPGRRRTLLYFTIRNPYHVQYGYPDCNSIYPDLDGTLKLSQFY